ncbi:peptide-binding protein [Pedobacter sp. HMF7647]|uniref:Peptide-binding protein n=1 Tax=Hufsiella arboris TaxID=2695275 RepID=A0A7K1Y580_9SPHI|nr:aspartyl protease family protein [Hufsiella arboris]MXV49746.1 peptide-binding protein [Hufsiella arboris]
MMIFKNRRRTLWLFMSMLFSFLNSSLEAQSLQFKNNRKRETIDFKFIKNLIVIPLEINGQGPFNFVLDTGVGLFIITDPKLVDSVGINNLRSININGFGEGGDLSAYISPSIQIDIGNSISGNCAAAILKKDRFNLSEYTGMPIHGLIGYEFFSSFIVRINYAQKTIVAYDSKVGYIPKKGFKVPITIEEHKPYVTAAIDLDYNRKMMAKLIIDTGAGHPLSLESDNGQPIVVPAVNIPANLGIGLSGPINGYLARLKSIKLGKFQLDNIISAFPNYNDVGAKVNSQTRNGNIGNNVLKRFELVFDYERQCMYLRRTSSYSEPFEHDMSGLELMAAGDDFNRIIVSRVEPGSAAVDAGLENDDEILSINFKPVKEMTMEEIDAMFRSRNDRSFIMDVLPHGQKNRVHVILTLRRRI